MIFLCFLFIPLTFVFILSRSAPLRLCVKMNFLLTRRRKDAEKIETPGWKIQWK